MRLRGLTRRAAQRTVGHDAAQIVLHCAHSDDVKRRAHAHRAIVHDGLANRADLVRPASAPRCPGAARSARWGGSAQFRGHRARGWPVGIRPAAPAPWLASPRGPRDGERQAGRTCAHDQAPSVFMDMCAITVKVGPYLWPQVCRRSLSVLKAHCASVCALDGLHCIKGTVWVRLLSPPTNG